MCLDLCFLALSSNVQSRLCELKDIAGHTGHAGYAGYAGDVDSKSTAHKAYLGIAV